MDNFVFLVRLFVFSIVCLVFPGNTAGGLECDGATINLCKKYSPSWKAARIDWDQLQLSGCKEGQPQAGDQMLLFVSRGKLYNYGKYEIVTIKLVNSTIDKKG